MNYNTYLYEFIIYPSDAAGTNFNLRDIPDLKDAQIFGLESYNVNDIALTKNGNDVISAAVMQNTFLRLYIEDASGLRGTGAYIRDLPLVNLHNIQNSNSDAFERWPFDMPGQKVYWDKCELFLGAAIGNSDNVSFLFNINYKFTTKA